MISKSHRFKGHNSLNYVYRKGRTVRAPYCSVRYVRSNQAEGYRLAIVVSKKVSKSAVVRNRIRRRMYEAFRERLKGHELTRQDMIVSVFAVQLADVPYKDIEDIVDSLLKQTA